MSYFTLSGVFDGIGLETEENLHDSLFIRVDEKSIIVCIVVETEIDSFLFRIILLHVDNFLHHLGHVEFACFLIKLSSFYLSLIKHILNSKLHEVG